MSDEDKDKTLSKKQRGPKPKHREQIRKLHDAGYTPKEIQNETGASQSAVSKELKKYREDEPVNYYNVFSSEEESKALQKIEPMPARSRPISTRKIRAPARNRVYTQTEKLKPSPIKLMLKDHYQTCIRHALDNSYRWTKYNIQEIRTYLKDTELKLNPVTIEFISAHPHQYIRSEILARYYPIRYVDGSESPRPYTITHAKELYKILGVEWKQPKASVWIKLLLKLWETSRATRGLTKEYLTIKEWYEKMELEFPQLLEIEENMVITNRKDLERTGIFEDIEYHIKTELKISDEIEEICHTHNEELTTTDLWHMKNLLRENPDHPYAVLLKEKIQDYEIKTGDTN